MFNAGSHEVEGLVRSGLQDVEQYCGCFIEPQSYTPQQASPGCNVTRATELATFLDHPDAVVVRCQLGYGAGVLRNSDGQDLPTVNAGEEVTLPMPAAESRYRIQYVMTTDCSLFYELRRGSVWDIVHAEVGGFTRMQKACFP